MKEDNWKELVKYSQELDIPPIVLSHYEIPPSVVKYLPEDFVRAQKVIPLAEFCSVLTVAISPKANILNLLDSIKTLTGCEVQPVLSTEEEIIRALDRYYTNKKRKEEVIEEKEEEISIDDIIKEEGWEEIKEEAERVEVSFSSEEKFDIEEAKKLAKHEKIINMVNAIITEALKRRTSDIHIEPFSGEVRLRYRIDGMLQEINKIEKKYEQALVARLKLMSKMDITLRKIPQDGRFTVTFQGEDIDCRVSSLPTHFGEKVVIRLLHRMGVELNIEKLGFSENVLEVLREIIKFSHGVFLLTGPTGSGKTTTLYSLLNFLNTPHRNILTVEDPVEYKLYGITQINVKPEIGLTFAHILRSLLRQAPDIIMIGEIRDLETAQIALKAALTGSFILSTLHTNDAPSAISRLKDMGIEKYLISSALLGAAAQRLCRKICSRCREKVKIEARNICELNLQKDYVYRGKGCNSCGFTGYRGRVPISEILAIDLEIKEMILKEVSLDEIREYARKTLGFLTLKEDGISKIEKGITTPEEVLRVAL